MLACSGFEQHKEVGFSWPVHVQVKMPKLFHTNSVEMLHHPICVKSDTFQDEVLDFYSEKPHNVFCLNLYTYYAPHTSASALTELACVVAKSKSFAGDMRFQGFEIDSQIDRWIGSFDSGDPTFREVRVEAPGPPGRKFLKGFR